MTHGTRIGLIVEHKTGVIGRVYIIRFEPPFKHARFYVGWCSPRGLQNRLRVHRSGHGAKITAAAVAAGCRLVLVWDGIGTRADERAIKNMHNTPRYVRRLEQEGRLFETNGLKQPPKRDNLPAPLTLEDLL